MSAIWTRNVLLYIDAGSLDRLARDVSSFIKGLEFGAERNPREVPFDDAAKTLGTPPNATKGVAITYGAVASTQSRQQSVALATQYLCVHLSDSQNAAGQWSQPTFDVGA